MTALPSGSVRPGETMNWLPASSASPSWRFVEHGAGADDRAGDPAHLPDGVERDRRAQA